MRLINLLLFLSLSLSVVWADGKVNRVQPTPPELFGIGVTFEKVDFHFDSPVTARFWIETETGNQRTTMEVPHDHVLPATHYVLSYVQSGGGEVELTAATDTAPPLNRRTVCIGIPDNMYSRNTKYLPVDAVVPLDRDMEIFEARGVQNWRHPDVPIPIVRIWAHFSR